MASIPLELLSIIIDFVWDDSKGTSQWEDINACSLSCRVLHHECRMRMFSKLELELPDENLSIDPSTDTHSSSRLSGFCSLLQDNPRLGSYVVSMSLYLPREVRTHGTASSPYCDYLPSVLRHLRRLKHLLFESHRRVEWRNLHEAIRSTLYVGCALGALSTIRFTRVYNIPSSLLTSSKALPSVYLKDAHVISEDVCGLTPPTFGDPSIRETSLGRLHLEHSDVSDILARSRFQLCHLRSLHTRLAVSHDTQKLIDISCGTLKEFSCEGKAMARLASLDVSEGAAGVGPFSFSSCILLQSLECHYDTPRGNINDFAQVMVSTLQTLDSDICLEQLKLSFQVASEHDLVKLLSSSFWSQLDALYYTRRPFSCVRVRLETGRPRHYRQPFVQETAFENRVPLDMKLLPPALEAVTRSLPSLRASNSISFSINNCPRDTTS